MKRYIRGVKRIDISHVHTVNGTIHLTRHDRMMGTLSERLALQSRREYYAAQILYEILDMLSALTRRNNSDCDQYAHARSGDLSREAKKELYLQDRDKGYEH